MSDFWRVQRMPKSLEVFAEDGPVCEVFVSAQALYDGEDDSTDRAEAQQLARAKLIALAPEMRATLIRVQWGNEMLGECPDCHYTEENEGHAVVCKLAALLERLNEATA